MGLDMYLLSVPKINGMELEDILLANCHLGRLEEEGGELYERVKKHIKSFEEFGSTWRSLKTEIFYWRKANQFHHWFVETVQNGADDMDTYSVTSKNVKELYDLCELTIRQGQNPNDILPTRPGPFFGSTDYDKYYYWEVKRTQSFLSELLTTFNFDTHYLLYHANW
jgi:hypothetical protein